MIHLKRNYEIILHYEWSKEDKQLFILMTMYEQMSLKQLDNSLLKVIGDLHYNQHVVTMAEVKIAGTDNIVANSTFLSLMNIPGPITTGIFRPVIEVKPVGKED